MSVPHCPRLWVESLPFSVLHPWHGWSQPATSSPLSAVGFGAGLELWGGHGVGPAPSSGDKSLGCG